MAHARLRSPSPPASNKRAKTAISLIDDTESRFAPGLLTDSNIQRLNQEYLCSEPYKYCVIDKLFNDTLLSQVKDECIQQLGFTEKSTDIYRVHQTGDLASLSYLPKEQLDLLQGLLVLRDALYSSQFREFLQRVTGCGALSGIKQDMSVNSYKSGCHLLNHDDVIGTRRVSYILYMPLPVGEKWDESWGGTLELYPAKNGEPETIPTKRIPPAWNQFIFFEVQPGKSFHSVEEVVVGGGNDPRERLSISGWFHQAQEGEEGHEFELADREKSSLEQLTSGLERTFIPYPDDSPPPIPPILSEEDKEFLSQFMNPLYFSAKNLSMMAESFAAESSLQAQKFLREDLAAELEVGLRQLDTQEQLGHSRERMIPLHSNGAAPDSDWIIKGPPHKHRYCVFRNQDGQPEGATKILKQLQDVLFPSPAFRTWLALVSSLLPLQYSVEARRFRPGLDYTLATSENGEIRLDAVLCLTPDIEVEGKGKGKAEANWESGEWGGWQCYMAADEDDDDPAVYGSGKRKKEKAANGETNDEDEDSDDEDGSGTLLTVQPGFNRLQLVLRDAGVLHFVKYVSAKAHGSRWDVCCEWEVGQVELEEDEDGNLMTIR
ncbi:hypothetical protein Clacol_001417 [Clathrus columnatus]|uniref:uS12 prolyl 3,4-dihydroxylase n=1 Tax=Clathrus columnatus TaxID=1419009 RepID=A0AAV4ZY81_9AGAM|nr:hypothetical protein Clacol_001417 [Clathrus columnatus]